MSHCELLHESLAKRGLTFLWGEVQTRGAGRHPCCCVNRNTRRRQRRERQWRKERHQIDSPCLVNGFLPTQLHLHTSLTPSHLHTYLPCHTLPSSHPHTLTPSHIPTMHTHPHTFTPAHIPTTPLTELGVSDKSPAEAESDKSDMEETEDVCPICLNELDEGEDLLVCSGCHNHLHHHCMDVCEW